MRKQLKAGLIPLCVALFVLSGVVDHCLTPEGVAKGYLADAGSARQPSSVAVAHAAGEFRIVAANLLWMNVVDHYHHQYMAQGGIWARNKDLLPLIHMIVTLDPHFIQAYDVDMLILCELKRYGEAKDMLNQAMHDNPQDWQMPYDMAMIYAWYQKDPASALPYAETADRLVTDSFYKRMCDIFCHTLKRDIHDNQVKAKKAAKLQATAHHI